MVGICGVFGRKEGGEGTGTPGGPTKTSETRGVHHRLHSIPARPSPRLSPLPRPSSTGRPSCRSPPPPVWTGVRPGTQVRETKGDHHQPHICTWEVGRHFHRPGGRGRVGSPGKSWVGVRELSPVTGVPCVPGVTGVPKLPRVEAHRVGQPVVRLLPLDVPSPLP